jgi:hypothetical protein
MIHDTGSSFSPNNFSADHERMLNYRDQKSPPLNCLASVEIRFNRPVIFPPLLSLKKVASSLDVFGHKMLMHLTPHTCYMYRTSLFSGCKSITMIYKKLKAFCNMAGYVRVLKGKSAYFSARVRVFSTSSRLAATLPIVVISCLFKR